MVAQQMCATCGKPIDKAPFAQILVRNQTESLEEHQVLTSPGGLCIGQAEDRL